MQTKLRNCRPPPQLGQLEFRLPRAPRHVHSSVHRPTCSKHKSRNCNWERNGFDRTQPARNRRKSTPREPVARRSHRHAQHAVADFSPAEQLGLAAAAAAAAAVVGSATIARMESACSWISLRIASPTYLLHSAAYGFSLTA